MPKYRKKPVEIEARLWDGSAQSTGEILDWINDNGGQATLNRVARSASRYNQQWDEVLAIQTLEGPILASRGDMIIQGVQGEFYPCKPDIFEQTYDGPTDDEERPLMDLVVGGRRSGRTQRLIDSILEQAKDRGLDIRIVEPEEEKS